MLTNEQIEAIAEQLYRDSGKVWEDVSPDRQSQLRERIGFIAEKAIAIVKPYAEQDLRFAIAIGKHIGIPFTAGADVVSEVYKKLDEIMAAFREHSQEIAIAQQIKTLINQLERYHANQDPTPIYSGAVGEETRKPVCAGDGGGRDHQD